MAVREVTSYEEARKAKDWHLSVQRADGDERMCFSYPDRECFTAGANVPCAWDPEWETGDTGPYGEGQRPPVLGVAQ
ncbi:hypothetical protein [Streptomyces coerulescens]|uniref:Uncharacterized protein n=1 Tax=Streptomyces coerulescens TaxID=29304 RepID=A0ABW0CGX4_STRCD